MAGNHYEAYLQRLQEHFPHGEAHDQGTHATRYGNAGGGPDGDKRTAAERAATFAAELGDTLDDTGEYIQLMTPDGRLISFTNWDEVEAFERQRFQKKGGDPEIIAPVSHGDPAVQAPRRGPMSQAGAQEEVPKVKAYDEEEEPWTDEDWYTEEATTTEDASTTDDTTKYAEQPSGGGETTSETGQVETPYYPNTVPQAASGSTEKSHSSSQTPPPSQKKSTPAKPVSRAPVDQTSDPMDASFEAARQYGMKLASQLGVPFEDGGHYVKVAGKQFHNWREANSYLQTHAREVANADADRQWRERETKAQQALPGMARDKNYQVAEQDGTIKLSSADGVFFFDSWQEASKFLGMARMPQVREVPVPEGGTSSAQQQAELAARQNRSNGLVYNPTAGTFVTPEQNTQLTLQANRERVARRDRIEQETQALSRREQEQSQAATTSLGTKLGWQVSADGRTVQKPGQVPQTFGSTEEAQSYLMQQAGLAQRHEQEQQMKAYNDALFNWVHSGRPAATFPGTRPVQKSAEPQVVGLQKAYADDYADIDMGAMGDTAPMFDDAAAEPTDVVLYENPIQPPAVPPGDPDYKRAEYEAKTGIEARLIEIGGQIRGMAPGFRLQFPQGYEPAESPEFTSWQQAAEWLGVELQRQPVPMQEARRLTYHEWRRLKEGGEGSGNFDHAGRPGQVGGSAPRSGRQSGETVARNTSRSGEPRQPSARCRAKREDKPTEVKDLLPNWYGGVYGNLMRQYFLKRPRRPADYPKFTDLTEEQQALLEKMIDNQDALVYAGAESKVLPQAVVDEVLRPAAKKVAEGIDFMTYDKDGRKLQDYINFATYLLGIAARDKYQKLVAEKIADVNNEIRQANARAIHDPVLGFIDPHTGQVLQNYPIQRKEMPRWLVPKSQVGHVASYMFNPFSIAMNVGASLFMGYALPKLADELKQYVKGDPRAFNPILNWVVKRRRDESNRLEESTSTASPAQAIATLVDTLQPDNGPVPKVLGPLFTDAVFDAMAELSDDEIELVIPLMAYLGEENIQSLADKGTLLPTDDQGQPLVSLKAQKALGMSDEQRERLTPIAMLLATLCGLYTAYPAMSATLTAAKKE
jgi:hypothetical protein